MRQLVRQFGKIDVPLQIPHLLNLQIESYNRFLQEGIEPKDRKHDVGLEGVFRTVFPIRDFNNTASLDFESYEIQEPKYDQTECIAKGLTYEAPIRIKVRLIVYNPTEGNAPPTIREIKSQDVYFGTLPLMTEKGTFIINGTERVIVNQLQRSPGVLFEHDDGKTHISRKRLYSCRLIPMRGSWLDFDFDHKDILYVRIDRRRKMPATILFRAMGMTPAEILNFFYEKDYYILGEHGRIFRKFSERDLERAKLAPRKEETQETLYADVYADGKIIARRGEQLKIKNIKELLKMGVTEIEINPDDLKSNRYLADAIIDPASGTPFVLNGIEAVPGVEIREDMLDSLRELGFKEIAILRTYGYGASTSIRDTLEQDKIQDQVKAQEEIYKRLRPSSPPTPEIAASFFDNIFRSTDYYDLSPVGRYKINQSLNLTSGTSEEDRKKDLEALANLRDSNALTKHDLAMLESRFEDDKEKLLEAYLDSRILTDRDILIAIKKLVTLKDRNDRSDDIDHLGNRRVRLVGELVENQYRIGLVRMERSIKERMSLQEITSLMPHDLINSKPVAGVLKEFFGTSQLSQFMDQTNSLSEVTHKRRLSALGPGGLTRERAGFEVRDVHTSHYGRICPIETPEGPNIGLIVSLTTFARVNELGFIETPYRKVENGLVSQEIVHLDATAEENKTVAQATAECDSEGKIVANTLVARVKGEIASCSREDVNLMDISPSQMVSISAALIPFLEHDDANRALMGSNMQRQAVPLLRSEKPLVGTGMEVEVARDSGACVVAEADGRVIQIDSCRITVAYDPEVLEDGTVKQLYPEFGGLRVYNLLKYHKSNQNSCFGQKPSSRFRKMFAPSGHASDFWRESGLRPSNQELGESTSLGMPFKKGEILADGPGIDNGTLALGKNLVVAFMPWCGYNYEDSILISERVVGEDTFTSIHIEEFEVVARDTKLGPEEITRDIPNVNEDMLHNLDESGIIRIGAAVRPDDILVGKITPKGETQLTPEEKLLRAIFGEKARDVKNTSLKVPPGVEGTIIEVKVFNRRSGEKDERTKSIDREHCETLDKNEADHINALMECTKERLKPDILGKQIINSIPGKQKNEFLLSAGEVLTEEVLDRIDLKKLAGLFKSREANDKVAATIQEYDKQKETIHNFYETRREKATEGDDLPPGVIRMVKVYIAIKRKLAVGDKMAGRHGNKGVVSCILPEEDMPWFGNGQTVDIVLNPLGVPSRMNIGQVMETHLGWGARELGKRLANESAKIKKDTVLKMRLELLDLLNQNGKGDLKALLQNISDDEFLNGIRLVAARYDRSDKKDDCLESIKKWLKDNPLTKSEAIAQLRKQICDIFAPGWDAKGWNSKGKNTNADDFNATTKNTLEAIQNMDALDLLESVDALDAGIETRTPVFDGAREKEIWEWIDLADSKNGKGIFCEVDGKTVLYDGRTGDPFRHRVTTGVMYILKLHHLVDEKIHARSTGPYSLVTQQPLGGKAQFGGQRLGEMEVWALEAYGAAYLLQEFLTVKSDDVTGRVRMYEKIVKGDNFLEAGLPESFNVLVKELMGLGLDVNLDQEDLSKRKLRGSLPLHD